RTQAEQDRKEALKQQGEERDRVRTEQDKARTQAEQDREKVLQDQNEARQQALKEQTQSRFELEQDKTQARDQYERDLADAKTERDAANQAADHRAADAKDKFEQAKADAKEQREAAHHEADRERAEAKREYEKALSDGQSPKEAKAEYDKQLADIDRREHDAVQKADQAEAQAKEQYQRDKDAVQQQRDEARQEAAHDRKEAKANYDRRMAEIQAESDRLQEPKRNLDELIQQRINSLPQPSGLSSTYSPYGSEFGGNLYNQDDLAYALGRDQNLTTNQSGGSSPYGGSPGMMNPQAKGGMGGDTTGERTRTTQDSGVVRTSRRTGSPETQENNVVARGSSMQTSSGTPFAPPMSGGPQQNQTTESGDRERTTWLAEEEDVWGTEEGGAPQALGR
ncbi:hypothetical protein ACWCPY_36770, partial [Streptomyces sp. NPDC002403]